MGYKAQFGAALLLIFLILASYYFHAFWKIPDPAQKQTQKSLFWRNMIGLAACAMIFGMFVALGPALRFTVGKFCDSKFFQKPVALFPCIAYISRSVFHIGKRK